MGASQGETILVLGGGMAGLSLALALEGSDKQLVIVERDPAVEIVDVAIEDYGTIRIHNAYVRYLLPMMVEVQFYEGVEARMSEIE